MDEEGLFLSFPAATASPVENALQSVRVDSTWDDRLTVIVVLSGWQSNL
jgi:hypothetical protein